MYVCEQDRFFSLIKLDNQYRIDFCNIFSNTNVHKMFPQRKFREACFAYVKNLSFSMTKVDNQNRYRHHTHDKNLWCVLSAIFIALMSSVRTINNRLLCHCVVTRRL